MRMKQNDYSMRRGFTVIEFMIASSIVMLLFLAGIEALLFYRRVAADIRWRIAANTIAYDTAWEVFNRPTTWFETINVATGRWTVVTTNQTSAFGAGQAMSWFSVTPVGIPVTHWIIQSDVVWNRLTMGGEGRLAQPLVIERQRVIRNVFR